MARLKRDLTIDLCSGRIQKVATMESMATITVATEGPNANTDAKTKASETEIRASNPGTLTVKDPVSSVKAARIHHSPQWFS